MRRNNFELVRDFFFNEGYKTQVTKKQLIEYCSRYDIGEMSALNIKGSLMQAGFLKPVKYGLWEIISLDFHRLSYTEVAAIAQHNSSIRYKEKKASFKEEIIEEMRDELSKIKHQGADV
jgi:hypothetical protein